MAVKLIALDIDGTLIPPNRYGEAEHLPSKRVKAAIHRVQEAGIAVILASGRMFPGTAAIARHLELDGWLICQQGCGVHTISGDLLHEFPIDHERAMQIIEYAKSLDRAYEWFNPLRYIASRQSHHTDDYARVSGVEAEYHPQPERSGLRPTGVGIISSADEAPAIHRALAAHHGEELHLLDFPEVTVASAPEANKGHALSLVCADLGIDRGDTVAVGDSVNDAAMLAWAGRGIALAHSDRYALDAADEVLDDDAEPLARFLESLVSNG
jgi:hypothetical protein